MARLALSIPKDWTPTTYYEREEVKAMKRSVWQPPTYIGFQAPVPPPPDSSTPAKVNARIREFCGSSWLSTSDKTFARELKAFRAVVPRMRGRVEDTHVSKWEVVRVDGAWTLVEVPVKARVAVSAPSRPAGHWTRRGGRRRGGLCRFDTGEM